MAQELEKFELDKTVEAEILKIYLMKDKYLDFKEKEVNPVPPPVQGSVGAAAGEDDAETEIEPVLNGGSKKINNFSG